HSHIPLSSLSPHPFFFNATPTTAISTLSLHDALPIYWSDMGAFEKDRTALVVNRVAALGLALFFTAITVRLYPRRTVIAVKKRRSEEHTSELQSQTNLVCRLLLEKKKT